ncbi:MAG: 4-(cytidine 5'-diphospho)-2-C-methyl-D-erythritol kinase, partial [Actinomycetota bacterium]
MKVGMGVRFRTHAKVNLFLRVLGARADGFHEVETILQGIDLHDEFEVVPDDGSLSVAMKFATGRAGRLPELQQNLVYRAGERLLAHHGGRVGADIRVVKGIPIGAGLGGGSSNAAGTLVVLSELWGIDLERADLLRIAGELGSDVPYCIDGGIALATERGQKITPRPTPDIEMCLVLGGMNYALSSRA